MPRFSTPLSFLLLVVALGTATASAATSERARREEKLSPTERVRERVLQMTEFFDTRLPGVLEERNMTLHFKPKFGDLRDSEFMRFPVELRYGYTNQLELFGGLVPFVPSPFNSGRDHRWGPGEAKFGFRYDTGQGKLFGFWDKSTIGLENRAPLGKPPTELNDHYTHVKPFVAASRDLLMWPDTTLYANFSYDRSVHLTRRGTPPPWVTRRHIIEVAPGLLYRPTEVGYFAEYRWQHIDEPTEWRLRHEVRFGTIWDIPLARTEKWNLPGKWQVELAYKVAHEESRDTDHGIAARVNWRTTLREVMEHAKSVKKDSRLPGLGQ